MRALLLIGLLIGLLMGLSGCGIEPWVVPYEREYLASPLMSWSQDPLSDRYRTHVYSTREGARGATVSQGGGCGCN